MDTIRNAGTTFAKNMLPDCRISLVAWMLALSCLATAFGQETHPDRPNPIKSPFSPNGRYQLVMVHSLWPSEAGDTDTENWYSACLLDRDVGANRGGARVIANVDQTLNQPAPDDFSAIWSADSQRLAFVGTAKHGGDYLAVFSISAHEGHEQKLPDYWNLPAVLKLVRKIPGFESGFALPNEGSSIDLSDLKWQSDHILTATIGFLVIDQKTSASASVNVEGRFEEGKEGWRYVITKISQQAQ